MHIAEYIAVALLNITSFGFYFWLRGREMLGEQGNNLIGSQLDRLMVWSMPSALLLVTDFHLPRTIYAVACAALLFLGLIVYGWGNLMNLWQYKGWQYWWRFLAFIPRGLIVTGLVGAFIFWVTKGQHGLIWGLGGATMPIAYTIGGHIKSDKPDFQTGEPIGAAIFGIFMGVFASLDTFIKP